MSADAKSSMSLPEASPPISAPLAATSTSHVSSSISGDERPSKKTKPEPASAQTAPSIPTSDTLLSARLREEIKAVWSVECSNVPSSSSKAEKPSASRDVAALIPPFKVGTLEMYRRFPEAYDLLMQHHNCSAVQTALLHDVLDRIAQSRGGSASAPPAKTQEENSSQPWVRVADLGCGTGRVEGMVVQHPAVEAVYAYDSETAMLKQCLVNTVRSAAQSHHYGSVHLHPVASSAANGTPAVPVSAIRLCGDDGHASPAAAEGECHTVTPAPRRALQLCMRPVPFQAIQDGFFTSTHHPTCHLVVCAWSLSYVMRMQWGEDHWHAAVDAVVQAMVDLLDTTTSDAAIVVLETLGNGSAVPTRQNTYTQRLEEHFGFTRSWVRTDYEFASRADAERMARFFFGEKMLSRLTMDEDGDAGRCRLMECTGIWTLWKPKQQA